MDVVVWLRGLGLGKYEAAFRENEIDEAVLPSLTHENLKELGVTALGHRLKLLDAIALLRADKTAKALPPEAPSTAPKVTQETAERRQVTVMFSDLVGSTALSARMDPEDLREVISGYQKCVAETVQRFGGFVAKYMGDGVLVYFGYPQAHEDDAERAVRSGLELIQAVGGLKSSAPLQTRVGIATGLVVVGDLIGSGEAQERGIVGETPNLAARLQGIAEPNSVVIAESTRKLVGNLFELEDFGPQELKGVSSLVRAWVALQPSSVESRFEAFHASGLTELVGRGEELEILLRRWTKAKSGEGQVVLLSGEAGIGKSRLTAALLEAVASERHTRVRNFCSPQHTDSALYPTIGQIGRAAGFTRDDTLQAKLDKLDLLLAQSSTSARDTALFAEMLSLPNDGRYPTLDLTPQQRRQQTLEALASQVAALSSQRPLLMIFEDAHWADPTSLELLSRIVDKIPTLRVLLIVTFRPEFDPPWIGRPHVTALTLNRLAERETSAIISHLVGNKSLPPSIRQDIIERTDGIPLFVEEMTKAVLEAGDEGAAEHTIAVVPSPVLAVPASLHASLMARLDRLGPAKEVAQIGAVMGREFSHALLVAVVRKSEEELGSALGRLTAAGLLFRQGVPPQSSYLFKHALVQDTAYGTLLREPRRALHARIAETLESQFAEIAESQPEVLARHFTEAGMSETAIQYWSKAGERALQRSANAEAAAHLTSAIELIRVSPKGGGEGRLELRLQMALGSAARAIHGHAAPETLRVYTRARDLLDDTVPLKEQMAVLYGLFAVTLTRGEYAAARPVAEQALAVAAPESDPEATAFANRMMGVADWATGDFLAAAPRLRLVADLYAAGSGNVTDLRYSQDHSVWSLSLLALALWPLGFVDQAIEAASKALARAHQINHAMTSAFALIFGSTLCEFIRADPLRGGHLFDEALDYCVNKDLRAYFPWSRFYGGLSLINRGQLDQGLEMMRGAMAAAKKINAKMLWTPHLGSLALAHARAGQAEPALHLLSEALAAVEDMDERMFEAELHRIIGDVLLSVQRQGEAEVELTRAIAIARQQQAKSWELRASTSLARLWRDQGKVQEARELLAPAYEWFTEGFDTRDLKEANALLDELAA
jgi:class 3 adenylate cyclase/tetratricopeptide (TPR) repeat protein